MYVAHNCLKILKKTSKSYENQENAFDKTREPLFFWEILSFWANLGNFENQQKTLGKWFWTNFVKNNFSENCRQILGECSVLFSYDKLFINQIASPYCEILSPRFLRMDLSSSVHTSKSQA